MAPHHRHTSLLGLALLAFLALHAGRSRPRSLQTAGSRRHCAFGPCSGVGAALQHTSPLLLLQASRLLGLRQAPCLYAA
jgi:hypothetical protein